MGSAAYDRIRGILEGEVKIKGNKTRDVGQRAFRGRAERVIRRAPEVMVKISGFGKGAKHVKAHLDYVGRNSKLDLENERGEKISGKQAIRELHKEWMQDRGKRNARTRDTTNIILSMPPDTNKRRMKKAVRDFSKQQFGDNHQYVWVMHEDEAHPHAHLTVKNLGFDGTRLHVARGDPQKWRELFAAKLREQGIEAEATARAPRGKIKKAERQSVHHIRKRGEIPKVDRAKVKEAAIEMSGGSKRPRPWEQKIVERQSLIRKGWLLSAKELASSNDPDDRKLSDEIVTYVKNMPPMKTERHDIQERLAANAKNIQQEQQPTR